MTVYLSNAFSLSMLKEDSFLRVEEISLDKLKDYLNQIKFNVSCVIGHSSTAQLVKQLLNHEFNCERKTVELEPCDIVYTVQLGFRPEEGKIYSIEELEELYQQNKIRFFRVRLFTPQVITCLSYL